MTGSETAPVCQLAQNLMVPASCYKANEEISIFTKFKMALPPSPKIPFIAGLLLPHTYKEYPIHMTWSSVVLLSEDAQPGEPDFGVWGKLNYLHICLQSEFYTQSKFKRALWVFGPINSWTSAMCSAPGYLARLFGNLAGLKCDQYAASRYKLQEQQIVHRKKSTLVFRLSSKCWMYL